MKLSIYGPAPDMKAITAMLTKIPESAKEVLIQAPLRRAVDLKPCQRPGHLEYTASVDNKVFIHLSQPTETADYEIKVTC